MRTLTILLTAILIISNSGCQRSKTDYSKLADHLCSCSEDLYRRNIEFEGFVKQKNQDKAMAYMDSIEIEEDKFQSCILDENKKLLFFDDKNFAKSLVKSIKKSCPNKEITIMRVVTDTKLKN